MQENLLPLCSYKAIFGNGFATKAIKIKDFRSNSPTLGAGGISVKDFPSIYLDGDFMGEVYSELWVKVKCNYTSEQKEAITRAWSSLLSKYKQYGIVDDTQGEMFEDDGINFGIGANDHNSIKPNYEMQYCVFGEFIWYIQEILVNWDLDLHIQKTGASG